MLILKSKEACCVIGLAAVLFGCSPALNWREIRPADSGVLALFPCKPDRFTRNLALGGEKLQMVLNSCAAEGATYALSHAELADEAKVNAVLQAMHSAAASNLGGLATKVSPLVVPGMAPHALSQRWAVQGKLADNNMVKQQFAVFARGPRVYQAMVVGQTLDATAADTFFGSLQSTP